MSASGDDPLASMQLHTWLGAATFHTLGPVPQMAESYIKALDEAAKLNNPEYQLRALWGLGAYHNIRGDYEELLATCRQFSDLTDRFIDVASGAVRDRAVSAGLSLAGHLAEARDFGERALATPATASRTVNNSFHEYDHYMGSRLHLSRILWLQGFADRAALLVREAVEKALSPRYSPPSVIFWPLLRVRLRCGLATPGRRGRYVDILADQTANLRTNYWRSWRECFTAIIELGVDDGTAAFQNSVLATRALMPGPVHLETAATIREELVGPVALARSSNREAIWCTPEVLRAYAVSIAKAGATDALTALEDMLMRSLAVAREQGALAWQLRTATSLAGLYQRQGDRSKARTVLAPIYEAFNEGFGTTDLKVAASLLATL